MTPTKDQQAQEYAADKMCKALGLTHDCINRTDALIPKFCGKDVEEAYADGYTACEQSMWRSVEEEEPPICELILCRDSDEAALAVFDGKHISDAANPREKVQMPFWMPIPSLPNTNTK